MSSPNDPPQTRREARRAQRAADQSVTPPTSDVAEPRPRTEGRRSSTSSFSVSAGSVPGSTPSGDPISYRTEVRPAIPRYEPVTIASAPGSAPAAPVPPPFSAPAAPRAMAQGAFRPRDFRPPGEQVVSSPTPPSWPASFADATPDAPLQYHTQARDPEPVPSAVEPVGEEPSVESPEPSAASTPTYDIDERTLTRRQLRALRAERGEDFEVAPSQPAATAEHVAPVEPAPSVVPEAPVVPEVSAEPAALIEPATVAPVEGSSLEELVGEPAVLPGDAVQPATSPATGSHWSVGVHDDEDPFANTFSREVGSATTSTNALVLPEMPAGSLTGPVAGTGEIIITGMIDVPRSVASTGAVPSVHDSPDLDDYFDANDSELVSTDSAPISAIHAVSGHTATRDVMGGRKPRSGTMLTTVLVASTVIMAVVAVGLFVLAAVNGVF